MTAVTGHTVTSIDQFDKTHAYEITFAGSTLTGTTRTEVSLNYSYQEGLAYYPSVRQIDSMTNKPSAQTRFKVSLNPEKTELTLTKTSETTSLPATPLYQKGIL